MLNPNDIANISLLKLEAALEENKALTARVAELEAQLAQEVDARAAVAPFVPSEKVRAALRMWFGQQLVPGSKIAAWVCSWPDEA